MTFGDTYNFSNLNIEYFSQSEESKATEREYFQTNAHSTLNNAWQTEPGDYIPRKPSILWYSFLATYNQDHKVRRDRVIL